MFRALSLVLGLMLTGCNNECASPTEDVNADYDLTETDVQQIMDGWTVARTDISCEQACYHAHNAATGWESIDVDNCTIELDSQIAASDDLVVGAVHCEGLGREYDCE